MQEKKLIFDSLKKEIEEHKKDRENMARRVIDLE